MVNPSNRTAPYFPPVRTLAALRATVKDCRECELYRRATHAVLGQIPAGSMRSSQADMVMLREQPGDIEGIAGRPFVGPAGKLLDRCFVEAGIEPSRVQITNAVKHFKWESRGKVRLHKKPSLAEVHACRPWLNAELDIIQPRLVVFLGAVAAQGLPGSHFKTTFQVAFIEFRKELFPRNLSQPVIVPVPRLGELESKVARFVGLLDTLHFTRNCEARLGLLADLVATR